MIWQQTPYTLPLAVTAVLTLASALYAFRQRHVPGAIYMHRMMLAVTAWIVFYTLELNTLALEDKLFWSKLEYIGIAYVAVGYFQFVLHYIGEFHKIRRQRPFQISLHVIPAITLLLAWTSNWHSLLWRANRLFFVDNLSYMRIEHGIWFWVFIGYVYVLLLSSTLLLLRKITGVPRQFRGQLWLTIVGSLFPWVGNLFYIGSRASLPHLDFTLFGFSVTAVCFMWALFHFSFLDLVPVAQEMVIQKLESGVIVVDGQSRVIDLNETAAALLQQDKKQILSAPFAPQRPAWHSVRTLLQKNQPGKTELLLDKAYYEASITLLDSVSGQANGRLITLNNITQQKNTELLLQRAKEAAEAADQAKTHFLTNMSHEIRTPLNAVVGLTEMLRQTHLNPNQLEMIEMMAKSSSNLMLLINNILDFAKLEAGNLTLNKQTFDLTDCLEAALDSTQQAAQEKQLKLSYRLDPQTPTALVGDPVRLRQILVNLIENGIKFTELGEVEIAVNHSPQQDKLLVQFVVKDTGIGIAPNQIENLFLPFHQVDGSTTRQHGGNGLGLVVCQRLVALMEGSIFINSKIGEGTAVHFSAQFNLAAQDQTPEISLRHHKASLINKRLLVITRDATQRRYISKEARLAGLEVYAAGSGHEASYWIANSQSFDVALLDAAVWQDEPAIVTQLRQPDTHDLMPVILLNPAGTSSLPEDKSPGTFVGSLTLPVTSAQLYDLLMNVLSVGKATPATHAASELMAERLPLKILLAEDNILNRRILKNMMDKLGYTIDLAENGQIAVEMAARTSYDVIMMDIQMPVMDGVEATRRILANSGEENRPYIAAVTAHALEGDREFYLSSGMNAYLSKPVTLNQLVEMLYQSRGDHNTAASAPAAAPLPASGSVGNDPIDYAELAFLIEGDPEQFLTTMTPIFLEDARKVLACLEIAVQDGDAEGVKTAAHTLKGTSASMAMKNLSHCCRELEMMARADNLTEAPQQLRKIMDEYGRILAVLAERTAKPAV